MNPGIPKSFIIVSVLLTFACLSCDFLRIDDDSPDHPSWARIVSIDSSWRSSDSDVTLSCTVALPTPCCWHSETNVVKTDTAWTLELASQCAGTVCTQNIVFDTSMIDLQIPAGQPQRFLTRLYSDAILDTMIQF